MHYKILKAGLNRSCKNPLEHIYKYFKRVAWQITLNIFMCSTDIESLTAVVVAVARAALAIYA